MERLIIFRDSFTKRIYLSIVKPTCFLFEPERVHRSFILVGRKIGNKEISRKILRKMYNYSNEALEQNILGIKFKNPVGLSAGFDKNAEIINVISDIGFGFSEVGSITAMACLGNSGKRLDRFKKEKSLWVNFGLNNKGADYLYNELKDKYFDIPVGISVAKTNCKETAITKVGIKDYVYTLNKFRDIGDYFTVNISCPNAYGGQPFSDKSSYESLLKQIDKLNIKKPIFVKLSPDLEKKNVDEIINISRKHKVDGFICTNLSKKKNKYGRGGVSGKLVEKDSNELLKYVYKKTKGEFILIGVGGIFNAEDAYKKIKLGANLVQLITGMIYGGPNTISEINRGLVKLLKRDGYNNISEAVGVDVR